MPIYVYQCGNNHRFDLYLPLKDYNTVQKCACGKDAYRQTVPTMLSPDIAPWDAYISPVSGRPITSYKERKEDMKRSGCVDYEPSLRKDHKRNQREDELKLEKSLDNTVEEIYEKMPSQKKEMLERELTNGADIEYKRI